RGEISVGHGDHEDLDLLFSELRRNADRRALRDQRMRVRLRLDLERRDVLPSSSDAVAGAINEVEVPVAVVGERVTVLDPPFLPPLAVLLGHPEVAGVHGPGFGRPHDELTDLVGADLVVVLVDDAHVVAGKTSTDPAAALPGRRARVPA